MKNSKTSLFFCFLSIMFPNKVSFFSKAAATLFSSFSCIFYCFINTLYIRFILHCDIQDRNMLSQEQSEVKKRPRNVLKDTYKVVLLVVVVRAASGKIFLNIDI